MLISNATTKGQKKGVEAAKYRKVRIVNPRIQECITEGALDLMKAVGFEVKVDFYDEKFLVYPLQENPEWLSDALAMMKQEIAKLVGEYLKDKDEYKTKQNKYLSFTCYPSKTTTLAS